MTELNQKKILLSSDTNKLPLAHLVCENCEGCSFHVWRDKMLTCTECKTQFSLVYIFNKLLQ